MATDRPRLVRHAAVALIAMVGSLPFTAGAQTWMLKAQRQLTCTSAAGDDERAALGVQWMPEGRAVTDAEMRALQAYVTGARTAGDERLFRYLSLLATFSYQANYSNDQELRRRFDGSILFHARARVDEGGAPHVITQIFLCIQAQLIESLLESRRPEGAGQIAVILADHYTRVSLQHAAADWPLMLALRAVADAPEGQERALNDLAAAALNRALALEQAAPRRASRLFASAAMARLLSGESREAVMAGARSVMILPEDEKAAATWRAFPAMYDASKVTEATEPPTAIGMTQGFLEARGFPVSIGDATADFDTYVRMAEVYRDLDRDNTEFWVLAFRELIALNNSVVSMAFLRSALARLAAATDRPVDMLLAWQSRDPLPVSEIDRAGKLYDFLLDERRKSLVIDARTQLFHAFDGESILHSLSRLRAQSPAERRAIDDLSFRVLQLDSFTRISVAAASTGLKALDTEMTDYDRFTLERFYTYMAQHSTWIMAAGSRVVVEPGARLPSADTLWNAFMVISVFQNETTAALDGYYDVLRRGAPGVAAMTVPYAITLDEFQRQLGNDQAVIASLVGARESYVWAIGRDRIAFERVDRSAAELAESVAALRASVAAKGAGGLLDVPAFDAAAAHELYRATVGKVASALDGIAHLYWYGDGALGAVPPAILVTAPPRNPAPTSMADFESTEFLVDRYSLSSLPDLYLAKTMFLKPERRSMESPRFAGIGAPLLSREELAQKTLASSFELAGGTAIRNLRSLPKLPAAREELDALAEMFHEPLLWLGDEADESRVKALPLKEYRVIAFATHGFTRSDIQGQMYPSLLLAPPEQAQGNNDGLLTTLEIGELDLDADLVLLSACNTATSDGRPDAEAFSGLVQSFLVAGARSLLVSHWPVASGAASRLSVATVEQWLAGEPLARSLQQSIRRIRSEAQSDLEAHPFFWGPFVLADDGAASLTSARP
jgi:CHAT domain-containing protein